MNGRNRREFLEDVGRGMLVASVGTATAFDLGLAPALAGETEKRLTFGKLEPLVSLMQETPPAKLLPQLVAKLKAGSDLKTLVSAAALANVRAFAGQDYIGFHTFMALIPAYQMSAELSGKNKALPVLKVLYRNSGRIQEAGFSQKDTLHPVAAAKMIDPKRGGELVREAVRGVNWDLAEARFAAVANGPSGEAFNHLQYSIQDEVDVHRVVLSWRAYSMLGLTGQQHAHSLLRQSVRYCLRSEENQKKNKRSPNAVRDVLPRLLDEHKLLAKPLGNRKPDDAWVEHLADTIFAATREQAAEAVAAALAEGMSAESIGEALAVAANKLVLHDPGRLKKYSSPQKPAGCVHGDSVGVHASDAANAWRHIAQVSNPRNQVASLIVGAYHTAGQIRWAGKKPYPFTQQIEEVQETSKGKLLPQLEAAIRANDQARACAVATVYGNANLPARPIFDLLLKYAVSQDGALHAEKYYRTATEEFKMARSAFRWRQVVSLARVTASEFGYPAPGYAEARELLGIA